MNARTSAIVTVVLVCAAIVNVHALTIDSVWDGGGSGYWSNAYNWSPDVVPKNLSNVDFNVAIDGATVTWRAQDTYSAGTLGPTTISNFTLPVNSRLILSTDGSVASEFSNTGTAILGGDITVNAGVTASPSATEVVGGTSRHNPTVMKASGASALLSLTSLRVSRTAEENGWDPYVQYVADNQARVELSALTGAHNTLFHAAGGGIIDGSASPGVLTSHGLWRDERYDPSHNWYLIHCTGTGSQVNLPGLTMIDCSFNSDGDDRDRHHIYAGDGGIVDLTGVTEMVAPVDHSDYLHVRSNGSGSLIKLESLSTVRSAQNNGWDGPIYITAENGSEIDLPSLQTIENSALRAYEGGKVLGSHLEGAYSTHGLWRDHRYSPTNGWTIVHSRGENSLVSLPGIRVLDAGFDSGGDDSDYQVVLAEGGGQIHLSGLVEVFAPVDHNDYIHFHVKGAGSSIDLSQLAAVRSVQNNGWDGVAYFTAEDAAELDLPALTMMQNASLRAYSGGKIRGSALETSYTTHGLWRDHRYSPTNHRTIIHSTGADSLVSLPGIKIIDAGFNSGGDDSDHQEILAENGGRIDLSGLEEIIGPVDFQDNVYLTLRGSDSSMDLSNLSTLRSKSNNGWDGPVVVTVEEGATLDLPSLSRMENVVVRSYTGGTVTGSSGEIVYSGLGLWRDHRYAQTTTHHIFRADGEGSIVSLPGIRQIDAGFNSDGDDHDQLLVNATDGGRIELPGLDRLAVPTDSQDYFMFTATGADSSIEVGDLKIVKGYRAYVDLHEGADFQCKGLVSPATRLYVRIDAGSDVQNAGDLWVGANGSVAFGADTTLALGGDHRYRHKSEGSFDLLDAEVSLTGQKGSDQFIEVGGTDVSTIWQLVPDSNFAMGKLNVGTTGKATTVRLMDIADNGNRGGNFEALYLNPTGALSGDGLTIAGGSVLVLNGLKVYSWDDASGQLVSLNSLFSPGQNEISYGGGIIRLTDSADAGDVNFDGAKGASDLDLLLAARNGASRHDFFDLDGDAGGCDDDDVQVLFDMLNTGWGDPNMDGVVDLEDASLLLSNWGEVAVGWEGCDFDASGKVDTDDASLLIGNWGNDYRDTLSVAAAGQLSQTVVPEPATAGLLSLCSAVLLGRRRRRSGRK